MPTLVALQIPIKNGDEFLGVVDVITGKAIYYTGNKLGLDFTVTDVPDELQKDLVKAQELLMESLSEVDDDFMSCYLDGEEIDENEIKRVIRKGTLNGKILPVLCGSAFKNKAIQPLLDAIVDYLPCSGRRSAIQMLDRRKRRERVAGQRKKNTSADSYSRL